MREGYIREDLDLQMELVDLNRETGDRRSVQPGGPQAGRRQGSNSAVTRVLRPDTAGSGVRNPYLAEGNPGNPRRSSGQYRGRQTAGTAQGMEAGGRRRVQEHRYAEDGRNVSNVPRQRSADMQRRTPEARHESRRTYSGSRTVSGRTDTPAQQQARRRKARKMYMYRLAISIVFVLLFAIFTFLFFFGGGEQGEAKGREPDIPVMAPEEGAGPAVKPDITEDFLTPNEYSRPGEALPEVKNIFVHYTANQGTSAAQNRSYFEQLKDTGERSASAHFIIGCEGEIIQCIPLDEIAYAVIGRNYDSISIECCYTSDDGSFTQATYASLVKLLKWLTQEYDLEAKDILRHYDSGGKLCPVYYVENESAWEQLKNDVSIK